MTTTRYAQDGSYHLSLVNKKWSVQASEAARVLKFPKECSTYLGWLTVLATFGHQGADCRSLLSLGPPWNQRATRIPAALAVASDWLTTAAMTSAVTGGRWVSCGDTKEHSRVTFVQNCCQCPS